MIANIGAELRVANLNEKQTRDRIWPATYAEEVVEGLETDKSFQWREKHRNGQIQEVRFQGK